VGSGKLTIKVKEERGNFLANLVTDPMGDARTAMGHKSLGVRDDVIITVSGIELLLLEKLKIQLL
jgi:hypothetical protein